MKVRCSSNRGADLPESYLDSAAGFGNTAIFPIRPGRDYVVYALTLRRGRFWYYILDETGAKYPVWHPAALFDVVDGRPSRYWLFGFHDKGLRDGDALFAFADWARHPFEYYDRLTDGEVIARQTFERFRDLMSLEFDDPNIDLFADDLGHGWLMCPNCREAWHAPLRGALIRCPSCSEELRNPSLVQAGQDEV